ncbi:MAG: ABC transporter substrate-binding protein [Burkholderiales bacterium]
MVEIRRNFSMLLIAIGMAAPAWPQSIPYKVGLNLSRPAPGKSIESEPVYAVFLQAMRRSGYVEGKNISYEWRHAAGNLDLFAKNADELVGLKPNVIVAATPPGVVATMRATRDIPIVMVGVGDPVALGFAASFARPGGNLTGVSNQVDDISGKYIQFLREVSPKLSHVAVLANPENPNVPKIFAQIQVAAKATGIKITRIDVSNTKQIAEGIPRSRQEGATALIVQGDGFLFNQQRLINELTLKHRMTSIFWTREPVESGALMSYGQNTVDDYERVAYYVDRLLKGAKAQDLPIEQPRNLKLTINRRTAKLLGINLSGELLLQADSVID